jgi:hypothetical protein
MKFLQGLGSWPVVAMKTGVRAYYRHKRLMADHSREPHRPEICIITREITVRRERRALAPQLQQLGEPPRYWEAFPKDGDLPTIRLAADSLISPHHFEKAQRVAHGMDLTDLVGVNGRDGD